MSREERRWDCRKVMIAHLCAISAIILTPIGILGQYISLTLAAVLLLCVQVYIMESLR